MRMFRNPKYNCAHYRERISECRNCEGSDAPYKICYEKKYHRKDEMKSKVYVNERGLE